MKQVLRNLPTTSVQPMSWVWECVDEEAYTGRIKGIDRNDIV